MCFCMAVVLRHLLVCMDDIISFIFYNFKTNFVRTIKLNTTRSYVSKGQYAISKISITFLNDKITSTRVCCRRNSTCPLEYVVPTGIASPAAAITEEAIPKEDNVTRAKRVFFMFNSILNI